MTSSYRVRTVPTRTVTTVRRQVIDDDGDFFDFPRPARAAPSSPRCATGSRQGGGIVTTTTTTTTTPRRIIRDVSFDIGLHFKPDDLSVKTRAGMVFITAKRTDGNITREFDRKVPLPDGVDPLTVRALLQPHGCAHHQVSAKPGRRDTPRTSTSVTCPSA
ncbi:hypothetical protein HPB52_004934 [Rhipicephalus sanguineus]|uniref:SHSP domain-containing protein n=1 Tax=Rhipicephalus sanguineus TaxID=34632 RepID=A0A9D4T700_RHISA|nr:hypothetical protein HPB52_004934 [Rhipicephalus sanguineus]